MYIPNSSNHSLSFMVSDLFVIIHLFIQQIFIETSVKYCAWPYRFRRMRRQSLPSWGELSCNIQHMILQALPLRHFE